MIYHEENNLDKRVTTGSENAPVQRAKQASGSDLGRPKFELISCFSSPDFFLKAVERIDSSHCNLKKSCKKCSLLLF